MFFFQTAESLKSWWGITLPLFSVSSPYFVGGVSRNHNFGTQLFHFSSRKTMQHVVEWHPSAFVFLEKYVSHKKKNIVAKKNPKWFNLDTQKLAKKKFQHLMKTEDASFV